MSICINVMAANEGMTLTKASALGMAMMQQVVREGCAQSRIADSWVEHPATPNSIKL